MIQVSARADAADRADPGLDDTIPRARQHPGNVQSPHGYRDCPVRLGRSVEAKMIEQRLDLAKGRTDVPVKASCFCKQGSV